MSLKKIANNKESNPVSTSEDRSLHEQVSRIYYHGFSTGDWREVDEEALEGHPIEWLDKEAQRIYDEGDDLKSNTVRNFMNKNRTKYVIENIVQKRA